MFVIANPIYGVWQSQLIYSPDTAISTAIIIRIMPHRLVGLFLLFFNRHCEALSRAVAISTE